MRVSAMKRFHRTTQLLKGEAWDLAPFLCVLFLLAFFLLFQNTLVRPRGSLLTLPPAGTNAAVIAPGRPLLVVALDASGRIFFENRLVDRTRLGDELAAHLGRLPAAATRDTVLVLEADQSITHAAVEELGRIARNAGIQEIVLTGRP